MVNMKQFCGIAERAGYDYRSYSGRGMFGSSCPGIVDDDPAVVLVDMCTSTNKEKAVWLKTHYRTDNMGLQMVIYWPDIKWEG